MGFNKRYVPNLEDVKKQLEEKGVKDFINCYTKPDALMGSVESMDFIDQVIKEYEQEIKSKTVGK